MKKILAMLLAVMMLLSVASVAMAEDATHRQGEADFLKKLTLKGEGAVAPSVTFSFSAIRMQRKSPKCKYCLIGTANPGIMLSIGCVGQR